MLNFTTFFEQEKKHSILSKPSAIIFVNLIFELQTFLTTFLLSIYLHTRVKYYVYSLNSTLTNSSGGGLTKRLAYYFVVSGSRQ